MQRTLGGRERLVDWLGRTESDVDEEEGLPDVMASEEHDGHAHEHSVHGQETKEESLSASAIQARNNSGHAWFLEFFARWGRHLGVGVGRGGGEEHTDVLGKANGASGVDGVSASRPLTPLTPRYQAPSLPPAHSSASLTSLLSASEGALEKHFQPQGAFSH